MGDRVPGPMHRWRIKGEGVGEVAVMVGLVIDEGGGG